MDDQLSHGEAAQLGPYLMEMGRDTLENWQSEFLQLLWQVGGLAYLFYLRSPQSKEGADRVEAKLDETLRLLSPERATRLSRPLMKPMLATGPILGRTGGFPRCCHWDGTTHGRLC
ncbi:DUF6766 family protein [Devosia oryzisoli]|uniref:DUF6766 family protein n=1 Tax=Devosia oryzisoli TaxID=2774138 RepID=UPI0031F53B86